jgi:hypothetical protein
MADVRELRSKIRSFQEEHGPKKCEPLSWDEVCELRAASMYRAAVEAVGSVRKVAKLASCDPKTVRDRQADARGLYLKDALKLGRTGLYELADEIVKWADEQPDSERTGSDGR